MNYAKTFILIAALTSLFGVIGFAIGGAGGMMIALVMAGGMNLFAYWNSDKSVLKHFNAVPVGESELPWLHEMVADLSNRANMPMPKVYIMENPQPNAFATGRNPENAAVAVTTGIVNVLSKQELAGVIAHELAHIQNRDTLIMTITATIAGAISTIANMAMFANMFGGGQKDEQGNSTGMNPLVMLVVSMIAPIAASVVQMTISRTREYAADRRGAEICGDPMALANALAKIENAVRGGHGIHNQQADENQAMAHLFIINPLFGKRGDALFSTHPNTQNRIDALIELSKNMTHSSQTSQKSTGDSVYQQHQATRKSALPPLGNTPSKVKSPWE
jgi:heat shock protein HtpX